MSARPCAWRRCPVLILALLAPCATPARAQAPAAPAKQYPSGDAVAEMLQREPFSLQTWPAWRQRLLDWMPDTGEGTTPAYYAAWDFVKKQASPAGELPDALAKDAYAWYLLGRAYSAERSESHANRVESRMKAEKALRRSLQLDVKQAYAHKGLAHVLVGRFIDSPGAVRNPAASPLLTEARQELEQARRLDPGLAGLQLDEAGLAMAEQRFREAESILSAFRVQHPNRVEIAQMLAQAIVLQDTPSMKRAVRIQPLVRQFPNDGVLACMHGLALAADDETRAAVREFDRARALGTDPATIFPPEVVREVQARGAVPLWEQGLWVAAGFTGFYGIVMLLMAGAGLILATWTRGS